jgi:ADP-ribosylglycohydrolase
VVILHRIRDGVPWRQAAGEVFDGTGSCGNGAAMRVAPLGAWFFDDLDRAARLLGRAVAEAGYELGNGARVTAQDTVPFAIWSAASHLDDYPAAIRSCVEIGGDVDTMAAIVGGIVAHTGTAGIPADWLAAREPLPEWVTRPGSAPHPGSVPATTRSSSARRRPAPE